jgi:hypothetical protein
VFALLTFVSGIKLSIGCGECVCYYVSNLCQYPSQILCNHFTYFDDDDDDDDDDNLSVKIRVHF